jgi:hypothetical protein
MRSFVLNVQITTLWYRNKNLLAGLNLNIVFNTVEYLCYLNFRPLCIHQGKKKAYKRVCKNGMRKV